MKRLVALLVILVLFISSIDALAAYEAPFSVQFEDGQSRLAGEESVLLFSLPTDASIKYVAIDFGSAGFVPTGAATLWVESWPNRLEVASSVTVTGSIVEVQFTKVPENAWALNMSVGVMNPSRAQRVSAANFIVRAGATPQKAESISAVGTFLDIGLKVVATVTKGVVGRTEVAQFSVLEGEALCEEALRYTIKRNNKALSSGVIPTGSLTLPLAFYFDPGKHSANYTLEVSKVAQSQVKGTLIIPVMYDVTVVAPADAAYSSEAVIVGKVRDGSGRGLGGVPISVINKGAPYQALVSSNTAADGSFTLNPKFIDAEQHAVTIGGTDYEVFDVQGLPLEIVLTQSEVPCGNSTNIELRVFFGDTEVSQEADIKVVGPDGKTFIDWATGSPYGGSGRAATARKVGLGKLPPVGEYTLLARFEDMDGGETSNAPDGSGSTKFVVRTSAVVVTPSKLEHGLVAVGPNAITVKVTDYAGAGIKLTPGGMDISRVRFTVSGSVTNPVSFDSAVNSAVYDQPERISKTVSVIVCGLGRFVVTGEVYLADGSIEPFVREFSAQGWVVEQNSLLGVVGEEVVLRAVVKTTDGIPVNHAKVVWHSSRAVFQPMMPWGNYGSATSRLEIDGLNTNVQDGIYEMKVKLLQADDQIALMVSRVRDDAPRSYLHLRVAEGRMYELTSTPLALVATLDDQYLQVKYTETQGRQLSAPARIEGTGPNVSFAFNTRADSDTPQFMVSPNAIGSVVLTPVPQDKSRFVPLTIPVRAPKVQHTMGTYVTENVWQEISIGGRDLEHGGYRPIYVRMSAVGAGLELVSGNGAFVERTGFGVIHVFTSYASTDHKFRFMPWAVTPVAENMTPLVKIEVSYNRRDWVSIHEAPIKPIIITTAPQTLYVGQTQQLTIVVTDANGTPCGERHVTVLGKQTLTNAQGQASFSITSTGTHLVPITVTLDRYVNGRLSTATAYVESKIK